MQIPVMRPKLPSLSEVAKYFAEIEDNRQYSNHGPLVKRLEEAYSKLLKVPKELVIATSNGTIAIEALAVAKAPKLDLFEVPNYTFAATAFAAQRSGLPIRFVDTSEMGDVSLEPHHLGNSKVGLIAVAPFGELLGLEGTLPLKRENVVFDFAAALLNVIVRQVPILGNSVAFSLHATKTLGCGEGGLVVARDEKEADFVRRYINFGFSGTRESAQIGLNGKMSEFTAGIALAAIDQIELEIAEWRRAREQTSEFQYPECARPAFSGKSLTPYLIVQFETFEDLSRFEKRAGDSGISTRRWWPRVLSEMEFFRGVESRSSPFAVELSRTQLGLPFFREMTKEMTSELERVLFN